MTKHQLVKDYMTQKLITFTPETDIFDAIQVLIDKKISGAPVLDSSGTLVGVLSEKDCIYVHLESHYHRLPGGKVKDYMSIKIKTISDTTTIFDAAMEFCHTYYRRFPVLNEVGKLVGQISRRDILRAICDLKC